LPIVQKVIGIPILLAAETVAADTVAAERDSAVTRLPLLPPSSSVASSSFLQCDYATTYWCVVKRLSRLEVLLHVAQFQSHLGK
jgi:hypothetical protein